MALCITKTKTSLLNVRSLTSVLRLFSVNLNREVFGSQADLTFCCTYVLYI